MALKVYLSERENRFFPFQYSVKFGFSFHARTRVTRCSRALSAWIGRSRACEQHLWEIILKLIPVCGSSTRRVRQDRTDWHAS